MGTSKRDGGWLPPRSGGYSPGKASSSTSNTSSSTKPPKGGAGVGKVHERQSQ